MKKKLKNYKRNCPKCETELIYKSQKTLNAANKNTSVCNSCRNSGKNNPNYQSGKSKIINYCLDCGNEISQRAYRCKPCSASGKLNPFFNKTHNIDTIKKITISNKRRGGGECKSSTRQKHRINLINKLKQLHPNFPIGSPMYNPNSISIIEQKAKELGITDLQHAENSGEFHIKELGYWVDGYSKEKNVVIEYYEKFHNRTKERDLQRQKEITKFLNCEFIIIKEKI